MRFRAIVLMASVLAMPVIGAAQQPASMAVPVADPADVGSEDALMKAVYDVISGPSGAPRNWTRMRSLFVPGARLGPVVRAPDGSMVTRLGSLEDWIASSGASIEKNGFFEREVTRKTELFGHIGHTFSTYESRHTASDAHPFQRGINSFQLFNDGKRWWVVSIYWEGERADNPIPPKYLQPGPQ